MILIIIILKILALSELKLSNLNNELTKVKEKY
jgi:hypothetical protein